MNEPEPGIAPEEWRIREVFAAFGLAMYQSNCNEQNLKTLLKTAWSDPSTEPATFEEFFAPVAKLTFGRLVGLAKLWDGADEGLLSRLGDAVENRNWLAHHYFAERAVAFNREDGQVEMRAELHSLAAGFRSLQQDLSEVSSEWGQETRRNRRAVCASHGAANG